MTKKFRMPVPGAPIRRRLECAPPHLESDEVTLESCKRRRAELKPGNKKPKQCPLGCPQGTWLYPRYRVGRDTQTPHRLHLHQGMDLGGSVAETALKTKAPAPEVVSVVTGHVIELRTKDKGNLGITVVVRESAPPNRWFLHAHLSEIAPEILAAAGYKQRPTPPPMVYEQQVLGRVGSSGNAHPAHPHLHFEVSLKRLPAKKGMNHETRPGQMQEARINPHRVLLELGPWGAQQLYLPTKVKVKPATIAESFKDVEESPSGGYFPLGANNSWHGGVHLQADAGHVLVAPLDGQIVAVRLDGDPTAVNQAFGSTNFLLLRHEIPASIYEALRVGDNDDAGPQLQPDRPKSQRPPGVGWTYDNDPALVIAVKKRLAELEGPDGEPFYQPSKPEHLEDGKVGRRLRQALRAFQDTLPDPYERPDGHKSETAKRRKWPDGMARVDGYTWRHLFPSEASGDDGEPAAAERSRTVYTLLMHVGALGLDDALDKEIEWVKRATVEPTAEETAKREAEDAAAATREEEDYEEAHSHKLEGKVGPDGGSAADIVWVRKRLQRLGFLDLPHNGEELGGVVDEELLAAIEAFEAKHVFKAKDADKADGLILPGKLTEKQLRKTRAELGIGTKGKKGKTKINPAFRARLEARRADGLTTVVSGLDVRVKAGEPLWVAGQAAGFQGEDAVALHAQVHWEMFSPHKVFDRWDEIVDDDDDLTTDAPQKLMDQIENPDFEHWPFKVDGRISPGELHHYYSTGKSTPLRTTQCKFRSEWALDLDKTIARLSKSGWRTKGLKDRIAPYQWWSKAADDLPKDPHVWHYNPIQFVLEYQRVLGAFAPPQPKDPKHFVPLRLIVLNKHGGTQPGVNLTVETPDPAYKQTGVTDERRWGGTGGGEAYFKDVPVGVCNVSIGETAVAAFALEAETYPIHVIHTDLEGDQPPKGKLQVRVRQHTGVYAKESVTVVVKDRYGKTVPDGKKKTQAGNAFFDELPYGEYHVDIADAEAVRVATTIRRKGMSRVTVKLLPPFGELHVGVVHGEIVIDGVDVVLTSLDGEESHVAQTQSGKAVLFEVRAGTYTVFARDPKTEEPLSKPKRRRVEPGKETTALIKLKELPDGALDADAEEDLAGRIVVTVLEEGVPAPDEDVVLLEASGEYVARAATDGEGVAAFEVEPGSYEVVAEDERVPTSVVAGGQSEVTLAT